MSEHESMRSLLALAAAGVLDATEQRRLDAHIRECEACRRESESWSAYAAALRQLPQPPIPGQLLERTRTRVFEARAAGAERRWNDLTIAALAMFAWTVGLSFWFMARLFTGGSLTVMGTNLLRLGTWSALSTALVWVTAAAAAVALSRRRRELRRAL